MYNIINYIHSYVFFYYITRGFPHFDGGEYFVWPMYVCSVLSIGKEGLSEFILSEGLL